VVKAYKRGPGEWYNLQGLVERYVQDTLPSQDLATSNNAQRIVPGVIIAFGARVAKHVAEEHSPGQDTYKDQPSTGERTALENRKKQEIVLRTCAQLTVNGITLVIGVHAVRIVAVDGKDDLEQ